jgi:hypothetical protein
MSLTTRLPGTQAALRLLLYGAMAVVTVVFLLRPLNDPDFFWHLKTGEWIVQHGGIPERDPFNYTNEIAQVAAARFTLAASWLSEVLYFLIYDRAGIPGILALKLLLVLLLVTALTRLRRGDPTVHAALILAMLPLILWAYPFDRPQVFSFILFAALLVLLERERTAPTQPSGWKSHLPLPLLMLLWSNMHGGHAIGQVTILLFIALEGAKFLHPSLGPAGRDRYRRLLIVGGAGLFASLANPNSYHALGVALSPPSSLIQNTEYISSVTFFTDQPLMPVFWGALALCALAILFSIRKPDITWIALVAGLGYQGFYHIRYIPFSMIAALPVIGAWLSAPRPLRWVRHLLAAGSIVLAAFSMKDQIPSSERVRLALRVNENMYPVRAADFILANAPAGNLYNTYLWGGYLIWRLGPERKVFVDGRGLAALGNFQATAINMAYSNPGDPSPYWKRLLRQYGVGYMIIPRVLSYDGLLFDDVANLRAALLDSPEWVPVYADTISLVFVQNTPEHRDLIQRHAIPRARLRDWWPRN